MKFIKLVKAEENKKSNIIHDLDNLVKNIDLIKYQINKISDDKFEHLYNGLSYLLDEIDDKFADIYDQLENKVDEIIDLAK